MLGALGVLLSRGARPPASAFRPASALRPTASQRASPHLLRKYPAEVRRPLYRGARAGEIEACPIHLKNGGLRSPTSALRRRLLQLGATEPLNSRLGASSS